MESKMLDIPEIQKHIETLPGWTYEADSISKDFIFRDFIEAFSFLSRVALLSEQQSHHPEWSGVYNQVHIRFTTHDAGGITKKDIEMARRIETMLNTHI